MNTFSLFNNVAFLCELFLIRSSNFSTVLEIITKCSRNGFYTMRHTMYVAWFTYQSYFTIKGRRDLSYI